MHHLINILIFFLYIFQDQLSLDLISTRPIIFEYNWYRTNNCHRTKFIEPNGMEALTINFQKFYDRDQSPVFAQSSHCWVHVYHVQLLFSMTP